MADKELKALLASDPSILDDTQRKKKKSEKVVHFQFATVVDGEPITLPICGSMDNVTSRSSIRQVTCPHCLAELDKFAQLDTHAQAIEHAKTLLPKIITPDPEKMRERIGNEPSRDAKLHMKARQVLRGKGCSDPKLLHQMMIGVTPRTFYKNMYEAGFIDRDGDTTGLTATELAAGQQPATESIEEQS